MEPFIPRLLNEEMKQKQKQRSSRPAETETENIRNRNRKSNREVEALARGFFSCTDCCFSILSHYYPPRSRSLGSAHLHYLEIETYKCSIIWKVTICHCNATYAAKYYQTNKVGCATANLHAQEFRYHFK